MAVGPIQEQDVASNTPGEGGLATRYAAALFDLADQAKALDTVAGDLKSLKAALAASEDLRRLVRSPVISRADQAAALGAVLRATGANDLTQKFCGVVAANRRLFALDAMIGAFLSELARRRGEITARVTSAQPLSDAQTAQITDQIKQAYGAQVAIDADVDPSLLGGLIVRIGSRMIDSSLKTKLDRMQLAMKGIA